MKVLEVINVRWYNAEADYCLKLSKSLASIGVDVTVMGLKDSPVIKMAKDAGLKTVTDINLNTQNPVGAHFSFHKMKAFLRKENFDIVNFHRSEGFILGAAACRLAGAKVVRTRGDMRPVRKGIFNRLLYLRLTDLIIASGDVIKNGLIDRLGCPEKKIRTIYTAVDTPYFTPEKRSDKLRAELKTGTHTKIVAILGRIGDVKGHDYFLKAAKTVKEKCENVRFVIIGKEVDNEGNGLKTLIRELGLDDDVNFIMGMRDDIDELAASVDIGVITSTSSEANCRVALEWMSSGVPVAAFSTGVIPEVVIDGKDGYVVPARDHLALADRIVKLIENEPVHEEFSKNARKDTIDNFSLSKFAKDTLEVYNMLFTN